MFKKYIFGLIFSLIHTLAYSQMAQITIKLSGFSSDNGKVFLMLLDKEQKEIDKKVVPISNKKASCEFIVAQSGLYAIKAFHDENNNQKLDTNILGIPKEKWGVSNNIKGGFGPPDFKKMLFEVKGDTIINIVLQ